MNFKSKMPQTVTQWSATGMDANQSRTFSTPVARKCYRVKRFRSIRDERGEERTSKAEFFLDLADGAVSAGDYLAFGDETATASPLDVTGADRIIALGEVRSFSTSDTLITAMV